MNNQINNGSSSTDNESVQRMVETSTAMHHSNQMVIAQSMIHRPVNTIKAYSAKQEEWKVTKLLQGIAKFRFYSWLSMGTAPNYLKP
ncbi:hypothetical protein G6F46_014508 [Rhizopus delemar]|nr:hypothetical protein G6F53_013445 [Rhizopus delemar]KAG1592809.1 hypothetical protein G6F46_014508 [Rhizopus delemar]KAG1613381.1 hypothetical protein G6F45_012804 [Rhizopus arrhizus]